MLKVQMRGDYLNYKKGMLLDQLSSVVCKVLVITVVHYQKLVRILKFCRNRLIYKQLSKMLDYY